MQTSTYPITKHFPGFPQSPNTQDSSPLPFNSGGSYCIPLQGISHYYQQMKIQVNKSKIYQSQTVPQVADMKRAIEERADLLNILTRSMKVIPEGGILHGCTLEDLFLMIGFICSEPPKYENTSFVGIPFAGLFSDLMNSHQGQQFFSSPLVNQHLRKVFNAYKRMLQSPLSLKYVIADSPHGWLSPKASINTDWSEYYVDRKDPHWGFKSFNDFFTRSIRPQCRPIDSRANSIVHSSDSSPLYFSSEAYGKNPSFNVQSKSHFWLKDNEYSLYDMLGAEERGLKDMVNEHFVGGTVYQAILCPWYYHRWHAPVSGTIIKSYRLGGQYFMLNPSFGLGGKHEGIDNYVRSLPMLSMVSVRQVIVIRLDDGSGRLVALVEIGMTEVSSCVPTVVEGQEVRKGDQLGYFQYGGSSYALVFDKGLQLQFNPDIFIPNERGMVDLQPVNSHLATFK